MPSQLASLYEARQILLAAYAVILMAAISARLFRSEMHPAPIGQRHIFRWPGRRAASGPPLLEASRQAGIPHASVCGGRGRCSTCRVHIADGLEDLPSASPEERTRAGSCRRAAQRAARLPDSADQAGGDRASAAGRATTRDAGARPGYLQGREQEIAILFADLRAFTQLAHKKLPYDTVFLLNRYFRAMGMAVDARGGHLDKFIGDGVMALFGIGERPADGSRRALAAARQMSLNLVELNRSLVPNLASHCASASAFMPARPSSAKWAMPGRRR